MPYMTHILVHEKKKMKKNIVNKYEKFQGIHNEIIVPLHVIE